MQHTVKEYIKQSNASHINITDLIDSVLDSYLQFPKLIDYESVWETCRHESLVDLSRCAPHEFENRILIQNFGIKYPLNVSIAWQKIHFSWENLPENFQFFNFHKKQETPRRKTFVFFFVFVFISIFYFILYNQFKSKFMSIFTLNYKI